MQIYTKTRRYIEIDGIELETEFEPVDGSILSEQQADRIVIGYLVYDDHCVSDDLLGDAMGHIFTRRRCAPRKEVERMQYELEGNADAVALDCYSHGGEVWSISGGGMQCQFDTAPYAGVWVPDECLIAELDTLEGHERRAQVLTYCKQFLEQYNAINNGEVYGCVVETFERSAACEEEWEQQDSDACWGFVGSKWAGEALRDEYFGPEVARMLEGA